MSRAEYMMSYLTLVCSAMDHSSFGDDAAPNPDPPHVMDGADIRLIDSIPFAATPTELSHILGAAKARWSAVQGRVHIPSKPPLRSP